MSDSVYFLLFGGFDEIGMNFNFYGYGLEEKCKWVIVDCGVIFGDLLMFGVDLIMFDLIFIEECVDDLVGMVLMYVYEDYMGVVV